VVVSLNTDIEMDYIKNGGILAYVLRKMIKD
jgi:aconitate hydratase